MGHACRGVRQAARGRKQKRFTTLLRRLTTDLLRASYYALNKARLREWAE